MGARDAVFSFLKSENLIFETDEGDDVVRIPGTAKNDEWLAIAQWSESDDQLVFYCVCSAPVPAPRRAAAMEFITRANFGLRVGSFELDLDDGEARFRTSLDFEGAELAPAIVKGLFYSAVATQQRYFPGLAEVVDGRDPAAALKAIDG